MKKHVSKYGTDARYPFWSGAVLDRKFFNGGTAVALMLNWGILIWSVNRVIAQGDGIPSWDLAMIFRFAFAVMICIATLFLIRHSDRMVQTFTRVFACGIPFAINTIFLLQRLTSGQ